MSKKFLLHWFDVEKPEEVEGNTIIEAITSAGYGAGASSALDWYEEITGCVEDSALRKTDLYKITKPGKEGEIS